MLTEQMVKNGINIMNIYIPNLFLFLKEKDIENFLRKSHKHTGGIGTANNNFIVTFFMLIEEISENKSKIIRNEFGYFNFLLGKFNEIGNNKKFKELINASLNNFSSNNFKHILGEIAACVDITAKGDFVQYEKILENGKSLDFHFRKEKLDFYIDVVNIDFDAKKYEKENFQKFLDRRLKQKFEDKSINLSNELKTQIIIYPILYGFTLEIVKEQEEYLKSIHLSKYHKNGFQSFEPRSFGNIQGTFFNLFSIDEIVNFEKYYK